MLDLVIIGGSAAGCSAAIYAVRRKLNFKMITDGVGGEVALSGEVGNWPGIQKIQGYELAKNFADHVRSYGVEIEEGWRAEKIISEKNLHTVVLKNSEGDTKSYETKAVIIATGIHPRKIQAPGVEEFDRRGVTYCTVCDGPLFRNKVTATVGSGNSALESAIMMSGIAKKVYLISKYPEDKENNFGFPNGENILIEKVKTLPNVEIIYQAETTEIVGDTRVRGLKYKDKDGETHEIPVDGVMTHIGAVPNSDFTEVEKDRLGQVVVNQKCATNVPGIFAAGDVTNVPFKQIGIAAGQGIIASLAAIEYINKWK